VPDIRIPFARLIVDRIFAELAEHGYTVSEGVSDGEKRADNGGSGSCEGGG
jgi:hypothetical protein